MVRAVRRGRPERQLVLIEGVKSRLVRVRKNPSCQACRGVYTEEPFEVRFCPGTERLQARPNTPVQIDLSALEDIIDSYPTVVRVRLAGGSVLVHQHGLLEFEDVDHETAHRFARFFLNESPPQERR